MRSKKQKAATARAWRILRMKGALKFMEEMRVHEDVQTIVEQQLSHQIEQYYVKELK